MYVFLSVLLWCIFSGKCPAPYMKFPNMKVNGGVFDAAAKSPDACKIACLQRGPTCPAADFNRDLKQCFLHMATSYDPTRQTPGDKSTDHYRRTNCG